MFDKLALKSEEERKKIVRRRTVRKVPSSRTVRDLSRSTGRTTRRTTGFSFAG